MQITEAQLRTVIRSMLIEITRTGSLKTSNIDYDDFTRWQKEKADAATSSVKEQ